MTLRALGACALLAGAASIEAAPARPPSPSAPKAAAALPTPPAFDLGDGVRGGARAGRIEMWTTARAGEGWIALSRRATGRASASKELAGGRDDRALAKGQEVVLPRSAWRPGAGRALLGKLFPQDRATPEGWRHVVTNGATLGFVESPWSLGALFAGDGKRHADFVVDAAVRARGLRPGDVVVIPESLLLPCWRDGATAPVPDAPGATRPGEREPRVAARATAPASASPAAAARAAAEEPPAAAASRSAEASPLSFPAEPAAEAGPARVVLRGSGGLESEGRGTLEIARGASAGASHEAAAGDGDLDGSATPTGDGEEDGEEAGDAEGDDAGAPGSRAPSEASQDEDLAPATEAPASPRRDDFAVVPGTKSDDGLLTYALDAEGPHAVYRLQRGETLYTHVVLRFTGLLSGRDVNDAARRLAARSRIADVTQIRVGSPVRIPLPDLLPQFLPPGHPRRVEWQQERAESARLARRERRRNLDGVHVLIDAGHGGADPGAGTARVWEDDFAYDIACRVMAILEERTRAKSHPLVKDLSSGHAPLARIKRDTDEVLLTKPPFALSKWSARSAVNLRWMLANSIRRKLVGDGVPEERIVFLSFHADSLHESARGSMAYYASAQYRSPRCGIPAEPGYAGLAEACDEAGFEMGRRDMLRAEGLSRALGEAIIAGVAKAGLTVHGFTPVRGSIVRSGAWVPAVLKYNRVQAGVLVEACNLNNPDDQRNLRDPAFRQSFAEAVVDGLETYFDGRHADGAARAAR